VIHYERVAFPREALRGIFHFSLPPFLHSSNLISLQAQDPDVSGFRHLLIRNNQFPGTGDTMSPLKKSSEKENPSHASYREGEQKVRACEKLNEILEGGREGL